MHLNDNNAVDIASKEFYEALNVLFTGDDQPMQKIWSHAEDVVYMGPDGLYLIGWDKVSKMWSNVANMKLGGTVVPVKLHTIIGSDISVIACVEAGENNIQGKSEAVEIRSSTVFRKENNAWVVIAHQTDLLAYMS